jgi:hypothetical protein
LFAAAAVRVPDRRRGRAPLIRNNISPKFLCTNFVRGFVALHCDGLAKSPVKAGSLTPRGSGALDFELHVDVAAYGVRIWANFLVRLFGERDEFGLRQGLIFHA